MHMHITDESDGPQLLLSHDSASQKRVPQPCLVVDCEIKQADLSALSWHQSKPA